MRDALWYLCSRDAGDQTAPKAQHLSLSVTPSGETSARRLAAGKRSHDRVKMSRLISDYSAFLWRSSTSLLQLHSQPVISASLHQQGICHWIQEWRGWGGVNKKKREFVDSCHFQKTLFSCEIDSEPEFFMLFTVNWRTCRHPDLIKLSSRPLASSCTDGER